MEFLTNFKGSKKCWEGENGFSIMTLFAPKRTNYPHLHFSDFKEAHSSTTVSYTQSQFLSFSNPSMTDRVRPALMKVEASVHSK